MSGSEARKRFGLRKWTDLGLSHHTPLRQLIPGIRRHTRHPGHDAVKRLQVCSPGPHFQIILRGERGQLLRRRVDQKLEPHMEPQATPEWRYDKGADR